MISVQQKFGDDKMEIYRCPGSELHEKRHKIIERANQGYPTIITQKGDQRAAVVIGVQQFEAYKKFLHSQTKEKAASAAAVWLSEDEA